MTATMDPEIQQHLAAQERLLRLSRYRAMQLLLECERHQQIARRRLLALRGHEPWGWLAL